jgi:predicted Zn finger-like uncharacterized protein
VAEAIHCPSCTTRYRLRPERLKPVFRRAKCCSCGNVFPVGDIVQRLLALPAQASTAAFKLEDVVAVQQDEDLPPQTEPTTLSPEDLDGTDAEILEKTLVAFPSSLPEAKVEVTSPYSAEITETTLSGYTSARDAIEKLFGSAPAAPTNLKVSQDSNPMDMEATLSALDSTLAPSPSSASILPSSTRGDSPTAAGLTANDLAGSSTSTMRLSQQELLAAIASAPVVTPAAAAAEPTVALRASDLVSAREVQNPMAATAPVPRSFAPLAEAPDGGAEMLRLKIGEDIYGGLTMPQLIGWVEEGRILENHLVARQHSENWLEAHKVPGLRPVFERLRRERSSSAPIQEGVTVEIAPKKSLFGGLFGKN